MPSQRSHFVSLQSYLVWLVSPVGSLCPERPCPHSKDDHCYCWYWYLDFMHNTHHTHTSPISYSWLFYINPNYYGFSASANILLNNFNTGCVGSVFECFPSSPQYYLKYFNFDDVNPYLHITVSWGGCVPVVTRSSTDFVIIHNNLPFTRCVQQLVTLHNCILQDETSICLDAVSLCILIVYGIFWLYVGSSFNTL